MMQSFQCSACGNQNAFGEPACAHCGQPFVYNCPICGIHINNQYERCRGCGAAFNWGKAPHQEIADISRNVHPAEVPTFNNPQQQNIAPFVNPLAISQQAPYTGPAATAKPITLQPSESIKKGLFSSPRIWLVLIGICVILIALLLVVDRLISK